MATSTDRVIALSAAINVELPGAFQEMAREVEEMTREVDRARMVAEDVRGSAASLIVAATLSSYTIYQPQDPRHRFQTWREFAEGRVMMCVNLTNRIDFALEDVDMLEERRNALLSTAYDTTRDRDIDLVTAVESMGDACRTLRASLNWGVVHSSSNSSSGADDEDL